MILVYFRGHGDWFIHAGDSIKLAVTRTTKEPYRDPLQHKRIEIYCPDYDEWLGLDEDNEENFTEWVRLYESTRHTGNTPLDDLCDFESKDYEYDYNLGGIFIRDPDIKGDVYDTNGLRSFGANYINCTEIQGVFKLNAEDEEAYQLTKNWEAVKKQIKTLLPCSHSKSVFAKIVNEGKLSNNDDERCYFEIQYKQYFDFFGKSKPIENALPLLEIIDTETIATTEPCYEKNPVNNIDLSETTAEDSRSKELGDTNVARLESLRKFIEWLGIEAKNNNFDFDHQCLDYTKDELFKALKDWEKPRGKTEVNEKPKWLWHGVMGWRSCGKFWSSKERKGICDIKDNNRGRKPGSQNISKKNFS